MNGCKLSEHNKAEIIYCLYLICMMLRADTHTHPPPKHQAFNTANQPVAMCNHRHSCREEPSS